jgi:hypothetical protein
MLDEAVRNPDVTHLAIDAVRGSAAAPLRAPRRGDECAGALLTFPSESVVSDKSLLFPEIKRLACNSPSWPKWIRLGHDE